MNTKPSPPDLDSGPAPGLPTDAPYDEPAPEIAHRTRLLSTVGHLLIIVGIVYALVELIVAAFPGWMQPPWTDLLLDGVIVLAGALMVWLVRSGHPSLASWILLSLLLVGSIAQFCIEGRPPSESAGKMALLLAAALSFVVLQRAAWVVLALAIAILLVMHALWVGGFLPPVMPRGDREQILFSIVSCLTIAAALTAVLASTMQALRRQAQRLRQRVRDLTLLHRTGTQITRKLDLDDLMETAVQVLHRTFGYHSAAILTVHSEQGLLRTRAIAGRLADLVPAGYAQSLEEGLMGWVVRSAQPVLVNDVESDSRYLVHYPDRIHTRSELCVPIQIGGHVVGILDVQSDRRGTFAQSDLRTTEILAGQIAVAMENARLYQAERSARQQLRDLVNYIQDARENERAHIAREILDEFGQLMAVLQMDISWLSQQLPAEDPKVAGRMDAMSSVAGQSLEVVQRLSSQLRPSVLDHFGLPAAIRWQGETFSERTGILHRLELDDGADALDREISTTLFRILQEALGNVDRHAQATVVSIRLTMDPECVTLIVEDDGRGITPQELTNPQAMGLVGMGERAAALGGDVTIDGARDRGTTVIASIPRTRPAPQP